MGFWSSSDRDIYREESGYGYYEDSRWDSGRDRFDDEYGIFSRYDSSDDRRSDSSDDRSYKSRCKNL